MRQFITAIGPKKGNIPPPVSTPSEQLSLRFFAVVEGMRSCPPDRGLWRILVDQALASCKTFTHGGRPVAAAVVHHVAYALYMESNRAGVIEGFTESTLAARCRLGLNTFRAATGVCRDLRIAKRDRASRRRSACWRLNLGGLDWPTVRARAKAASGGEIPLLDGLSQPTMGSLSQPTMGSLRGTYKGQEISRQDLDLDPARERDRARESEARVRRRIGYSNRERALIQKRTAGLDYAGRIVGRCECERADAGARGGRGAVRRTAGASITDGQTSQNGTFQGSGA